MIKFSSRRSIIKRNPPSFSGTVEMLDTQVGLLTHFVIHLVCNKVSISLAMNAVSAAVNDRFGCSNCPGMELKGNSTPLVIQSKI